MNGTKPEGGHMDYFFSFPNSSLPLQLNPLQRPVYGGCLLRMVFSFLSA